MNFDVMTSRLPDVKKYEVIINVKAEPWARLLHWYTLEDSNL